MTETDASPRGGRSAAALRRGALAMVIILLVQYSFGMAVNLFCGVPLDRHASLGAGAVRAISQGSTLLIVHSVLGMLVVLMGLSLVIRAAVARDWFFFVISLLGFACLAGAAANGAAFVNTGDHTSSMVMAMLWAVTLALFALALFVRPRQPAGTPSR